MTLLSPSRRWPETRVLPVSVGDATPASAPSGPSLGGAGGGPSLPRYPRDRCPLVLAAALKARAMTPFVLPTSAIADLVGARCPLALVRGCPLLPPPPRCPTVMGGEVT